MRRLINTEKLDNVANSLIEKLNIIEKTRKELISDIQKISDCYKGKDEDIIKLKYLEEVNNLEVFIKTVETYIKYFKWLSNNYGENLESAKTNFLDINNGTNFNKTVIDENIIFKEINNLNNGINEIGNDDYV